MITILPHQWIDLRERIASAGHVLNEEVFTGICRLFIETYASRKDTPAAVTREYGKEEYLLVVGEGGQPYEVEDNLLALYQAIHNAHSDFSGWFQVGALRDADAAAGEIPGAPILLAARWLCHLVGLRHRTVEIFIDPPGLDGHTLVQVRGMDKVLAPGAFDIPCAGHVSGADGVQESLGKELVEELNLGFENLEDLALVARYASRAHAYPENNLVNVEYCSLYRAQLKTQAVPCIRFSDGEVAALAVFNINELKELAQRFPERVASGLAESLEFYYE